MNKLTEKRGISSCCLHILAMSLMLCDHLWGTLFPYAEWLTCIGRLAFPIFAYMIAEGFRYTHSVRRYLLRLLITALLAEVPFNYMMGGTFFYPVYQNVLWTFLIALLVLWGMDTVRLKWKPVAAVPACIGLCLLGYLAGYVLMVDYYGAGVLMVIAFDLFRNRTKWYCWVLQFAAVCFISVKLLGGYCYSVTVLGRCFDFPQEGLAVFALLPIWLHTKRQGYHRTWFRVFCYAFYPVHLLVLDLIWHLTA